MAKRTRTRQEAQHGVRTAGGITALVDEPEATTGETSAPYGETSPLIPTDGPDSAACGTGNGLKIVVYAISKNESKFVERWYDSMKEADAIVVLDTGSTDDTVEKMKALGMIVETEIVKPWRFDVARNKSIDLARRAVPDADILVCTDLDEFFLPGWRAKLERAWTDAMADAKEQDLPMPTTAKYEYVWNFNADGSDGTKFWYEKIHRPDACVWFHPVHEILDYHGAPKVIVTVDGMRLEHHADPSKSRAQYLGLLELSVREAPEDDRNMHYLGREYYFRCRWDDCIRTLERHLGLRSATWRSERAASMRYIAGSYGHKKDAVRQELWLWRAINEAAEQREAALDLAELMYKQKNWPMLVRVCEIILSRNNREMTYLTNAEAWGSRPWDLYCIGLWYCGLLTASMQALDKALDLDPDNPRLLNNRTTMAEYIAKQERAGN